MKPHKQPAPLLCIGLVITCSLLEAASESNGLGPFGAADRPENIQPDPGLREVQVIKDEAFNDVTSIVVSPDGRHAYAAAFNPGIISVLDRNQATGKLKLRNSFTDEDHKAAVAFRLSADGTLGAVTSFRARTLILYEVDPGSGDLKKLDVAGGPVDPIEGLDFCIDCVFSPDGKFVYSVGSSAICVFKIENEKLILVETAESPPPAKNDVEDGVPPLNQMSGGRGIAVSPDGMTVYSTWNSSSALVVHQRNAETGKLTFRQALQADGEALLGLDGVMRVTTSRDGLFVYTSGGRFGGTDAVCTFEVRGGVLFLQQSLFANDLPVGFRGGNEIVLSPDQREVTVACTLSDTISRFQRDQISGKLHSIGSEESGPIASPGPAGMTWSPDGRFLHVADEESACIVTFRKR